MDAQHPGSPGEKANETSSQGDKHSKLGGSTKAALELPGRQGEKRYLIKQIDSASGERAFPSPALSSHRGCSSFHPHWCPQG